MMVCCWGQKHIYGEDLVNLYTKMLQRDKPKSKENKPMVIDEKSGLPKYYSWEVFRSNRLFMTKKGLRSKIWDIKEEYMPPSDIYEWALHKKKTINSDSWVEYIIKLLYDEIEEKDNRILKIEQWVKEKNSGAVWEHVRKKDWIVGKK